MKVLILAGGFGTRLSEYTDSIPKPMIPIGGKPIIEHIMSIYSKHGFKEFVVALGYKGEIIREYFKKEKNDFQIELVDTGSETLTGGRIKRLKKYFTETFSITYGDGVSDVNIKQLLKFHKKHKRHLTVTAVRPPARFGYLSLEKDTVVNFSEKVDKGENWINGGFFIANPKIFDFIKDDKTIFEKEPLEKISKLGELKAFKHEGFWQCMDHKIDKIKLDELCLEKKAPWLK